MNYLKLFEAFSQEEQVEKANSLFIEWKLFTSFLKLDIFVERNYRFTMPVFTFWRRHNGFGTKARFGILDYANRHASLSGFLFGPEFIIEPTSYTEEYLQNICDLSINHAREISMNMNQLGVYRAAKRYLDYLRNTPDKNHLLEE